MAPDLNSMTPSPYTTPHRTPSNPLRRAQESMPPPTSLPSTRSPMMTSRDPLATTQGADNTGVGIGPGPLRHPRPLTAADLHMQLEKEQEAVVNRLTRELSLLRAQTASVASNGSAASTGLPDTTDQSNNNHLNSGPSGHIPSRRHRSSSSLSGSAHSSFVPSTQRFEEIAYQRSELDNVKRENEALRRRVRELERTLSSRRQSENGITRSGSVSTNTSMRPSRTVDEDEGSVNVGESADSPGVGGGH